MSKCFGDSEKEKTSLLTKRSQGQGGVASAVIGWHEGMKTGQEHVVEESQRLTMNNN